MRHALRRPSPAMLVALAALFIALGSGAYAATTLPKNSVGSRQLKKNAVTSSKVKDHSLHARDFAAGQLPAGAQGPRGPQGAQGPQGNQGVPGPGDTIWQVVVNKDGTTQYEHAGITVATTPGLDGQYMISWSGFPGLASAYCQALGPNTFTIPVEDSEPDGTGHFTLAVSNPAGAIFHCALVGLTG